MAWKTTITVLAVLAFAPPAFATEMMSGHHACPSGDKKGSCMVHQQHHYMGHHACAHGSKKGGCIMQHSMGHHATPSGDKKAGAMTH
ncbi:MAG: hypothetical protein WDN02_17790 [Methylovirgula sp.]|uniref:hypothetical protein n=1 Tax=Methylovirgula sp. TaxID=1978224 RepID=UPI0030760C9E